MKLPAAGLLHRVAAWAGGAAVWRHARLAAPVFAGVLVGACSASPTSGPLAPRPFHLRDLMKSDVDIVAEVQLSATLSELRTLMEKLYRRNPREWKRTGQPSMQAAVDRVFDGRHDWNFPELLGKRGTACIQLAFDRGYAGDRVLAFVAGLAGMILASYNDKTEFFVLDELDPQKLYNSARNVETAVWKLSTERDGHGDLFLLSNSRPGEPRNLSFERLFGKIIAQQDTMARIVADSTNRTIRHVVQDVARAVFLPI